MDTIQLNKSLRAVLDNQYANTIDPRTLSSHTNVYELPDSNSAILKVLDFGTLLKLDKQKEDYYNEDRIAKDKNGKEYTYGQTVYFLWYEVNIEGVKGFVKYTDIAKHTFIKNSGNTNYLYLITSNYSKEHNKTTKLQILKYDQDKKIFVDSLTSYMTVDIIKPLDYSGWKNVDMLFRIANDGESGTSDLFIIDANNKIDTLISRFDEGDEGYQGAAYSTLNSNSLVYLPIKLADDSVRLILNGNVELLNSNDDPNSYTYLKELPANINFPKTELIVKTYSDVVSFYDKSNNPVKNKDGSYKIKKQRDEIDFYRWTGYKLEKVLTVNNIAKH